MLFCRCSSKWVNIFVSTAVFHLFVGVACKYGWSFFFLEISPVRGFPIKKKKTQRGCIFAWIVRLFSSNQILWRLIIQASLNSLTTSKLVAFKQTFTSDWAENPRAPLKVQVLVLGSIYSCWYRKETIKLFISNRTLFNQDQYFLITGYLSNTLPYICLNYADESHISHWAE